MGETGSAGAGNGWPNDRPRTVAIIGAGTMGLGVAECFAAAGVEGIRLSEATPELAQKAHERLVQRVRGHVDAGLLAEEVVNRASAAEPAEDHASAVRGADLVFEAVPERPDLKHEVLAACAAAPPFGAIIAPNTPPLRINGLAQAVEGPERFLGVNL